MKKLCLALVLVFLLANVAVFADGGAKIKVSQTDAKAGETVDIEISLEDNPGVVSMFLSVDYDKSVLTLKDVKDAGILGSASHSNNLSVSPYTLFWSNGTSKTDFTANGTAVTLTFSVAESAVTGNYPIKVTYDKQKDGIFNFNLEPVDFAIENGSISVEGVQNTDTAKPTGNSGSGVSKKEDDKTTQDEQKPLNNTNGVMVTVNGKFLVFADQKPVIVGDRTLVPLRAIFETLGADVDWDDATKTVTAVRGDLTISLTIGSNKLYVDGSEKIIDVPAQIINSRTMVPIRAIAESFGCNVDWDDKNKTVIITD